MGVVFLQTLHPMEVFLSPVRINPIHLQILIIPNRQLLQSVTQVRSALLQL
jgi:hypothetical protein